MSAKSWLAVGGIYIDVLGFIPKVANDPGGWKNEIPCQEEHQERPLHQQMAKYSFRLLVDQPKTHFFLAGGGNTNRYTVAGNWKKGIFKTSGQRDICVLSRAVASKATRSQQFPSSYRS